MMRTTKYYVIAILDASFLGFVHEVNWTWFDDSMKRISIVVGIIIGIITIVKGVQDYITNRLKRKLTQLEVKKKEEEVRRFFEEKYKS